MPPNTTLQPTNRAQHGNPNCQRFRARGLRLNVEPLGGPHDVRQSAILMRFEFHSSFREQYIAYLIVLFQVPVLIAYAAFFPLMSLFLLFLSLVDDSLGLRNMITITIGFA